MINSVKGELVQQGASAALQYLCGEFEQGILHPAVYERFVRSLSHFIVV